MQSQGTRFFIVAILALMMMIPMTMVSGVIDSRAAYSRDTIASVGREWGGHQTLTGPLLVIPVQEEVTTRIRQDKTDPITGEVLRDPRTGQIIFEYMENTEIENRAPVYIFPKDFTANIKTNTQIRKRGIFKVPVYQAEIESEFQFDTGIANQAIKENQTLQWDQAQLLISLSTNRSLRGPAKLIAGGHELTLEPMLDENGDGGIQSKTGDPRANTVYRLNLGLNGAKSFFLAAVGRNNQITIHSDWAHPSFDGAFLPDSSKVSKDGFTARWSIPHLARSLPEIARKNLLDVARKQSSFGVKYYQPNDFYQKSYRAARYGILFVSLTFLVVLLLDLGAKRPVHAVQFILIGLVQAVGMLLMVSFAEQIGFTNAYLLSSGAVIALLSMFGATALQMERKALWLAATLSLLYGVLFLILRTADFALLAGSTLAFAALAATMFLTRNADWHGPKKSGGLMRRFKRPHDPVETA